MGAYYYLCCDEHKEAAFAFKNYPSQERLYISNVVEMFQKHDDCLLTLMEEEFLKHKIIGTEYGR